LEGSKDRVSEKGRFFKGNDIFLMKGSVLFLSLGENFGKILKCTKNIEELTGYEEKEIVKREIK
jgi:hypothetical protein